MLRSPLAQLIVDAAAGPVVRKKPPACLVQMKADWALGRPIVALGPVVFTLNKDMKAFLDALCTQKAIALVWDELRGVCANDAQTDAEAERLLCASILAWPGMGECILFGDNNDRLVRKSPVALSVQRKRLQKIGDLALNLERAMRNCGDFTAVPSTLYWEQRDFENAVAQLLETPDLAVMTGLIRANGPTMQQLLARIAGHAERLLTDSRSLKAPKANRPDAGIVRFRGKICAHLLDRFDTASLVSLARIANSITALVFARALIAETDTATLKQLQRLRADLSRKKPKT